MSSTEPGSVAPEQFVAAPNPVPDLDPTSRFAGSAGAGVAAVARRLKLSPKVPGPRAAAPAPVMMPYAPPPAPTRLPIGGASAGSGAGTGSPAPHVVAAFEVPALAFATCLLARFSVDLAPWRSTLLASRLEHPD